jgi:hypothetical protein
MAAMAAPVQYPKENQGPAILGATLIVTVVATITFITRLYVRLRMIRNVGWDVSRSLQIAPSFIELTHD